MLQRAHVQSELPLVLEDNGVPPEHALLDLALQCLVVRDYSGPPASLARPLVSDALAAAGVAWLLHLDHHGPHAHGPDFIDACEAEALQAAPHAVRRILRLLVHLLFACTASSPPTTAGSTRV